VTFVPSFLRLEIRRIPHFGQNSIIHTISSATLLHSQLLNIFFPETLPNQHPKRVQLYPINTQKALDNKSLTFEQKQEKASFGKLTTENNYYEH